jgi:autotransporter-associated beta strand protein
MSAKMRLKNFGLPAGTECKAPSHAPLTISHFVYSLLHSSFRHFMASAVFIILLLSIKTLHGADWGQNQKWTTASLSKGRTCMAAAAAGGKVVFAGGYEAGSLGSDIVDIYDTSTGQWTVAKLSQGRANIASTASGNLIFFAGGNYPNNGYSNNIDVYDVSNNTWSLMKLSEAKNLLAATATNGKVFFGGGSRGGQNYSNNVDIYDTATNSWSTALLSQARCFLTAASADGKVFFGGGQQNGVNSDIVDIYNTQNDTWSTAKLSEARYTVAAATWGNLVLFGGGFSGGASYSNKVDIYNTENNTWSTAALSQGRGSISAVSANGKVFFAGGWLLRFSDVVDIFDVNSNTWSVAKLSQGRNCPAVAAVGSQVLFAGGEGSSPHESDVVDIYTFQDYDSISSSKSFTLVENTTVAGLMNLDGKARLNLDKYNLTVGSMSGVAPIDLGNKTLTTGKDNTNTNYSGTISGSGSLVKTGTGWLKLTATNLYTGATKISGGKLAINGSLAPASLVSVEKSGTLCGAGTVGAVNVASGGHIAPGDGIGKLHLGGNLTLQVGAILEYELGSIADSDLISMPTSTLHLNNLQFSDFAFSPQADFGPGNYLLIHAGSISGSLGANISSTINDHGAVLAIFGNDLVLIVAP